MSTQNTEQETAVQQTFAEAQDDLTGHDELAIKKWFGTNIGALLEDDPATAVRALVFSKRLHDGVTPEDAYRAVMDMTQRDVVSVFLPDEPELDEDEPETESGKGDSRGASKPSSSVTGATAPDSPPPSS